MKTKFTRFNRIIGAMALCTFPAVYIGICIAEFKYINPMKMFMTIYRMVRYGELEKKNNNNP